MILSTSKPRISKRFSSIAFSKVNTVRQTMSLMSTGTGLITISPASILAMLSMDLISRERRLTSSETMVR